MYRTTIVLACAFLAVSAQDHRKKNKIPTSTICKDLCPGCTTPDCKCPDSCWPGQSLNNTSDKDCACFAVLDFCKAGEKPKYKKGEACPTCWPAENTACMCFAAIGFCDPPAKLPTTSQCSTLCPDCKEPGCKCDSCWPGKGINATNDHTCECFAELGFCDKGKEPVYTPGKKCPSCWPAENGACDCFASIGFCEPPAVLPTASACSTICPGCDSPKCTCPKGACWPGTNITHTPDHTCECFAELGFCDKGKEPVYTKGKKCPSCWPAENTACDCFAVLGFCDSPAPAFML